MIDRLSTDARSYIPEHGESFVDPPVVGEQSADQIVPRDAVRTGGKRGLVSGSSPSRRSRWIPSPA